MGSAYMQCMLTSSPKKNNNMGCISVYTCRPGRSSQSYSESGIRSGIFRTAESTSANGAADQKLITFSKEKKARAPRHRQLVSPQCL
jgi:hypothetical protein